MSQQQEAALDALKILDQSFLETDSATTAQTTLRRMLTRKYYRLTSWLPRSIPQTKAELDKFTWIMRECFDLNLTLANYYTLLSQVMSGKPTSLKRAYGPMANAVKKLGIARLIQDEKEAIDKKRQELMIKIIEEQKKSHGTEMLEGTPGIQADVQSVPEFEAGVV